ncbi:hypothetical protein, partial [Lactococcus petauri]|uniref:hypothetical protein n=1 Tax=Lactococcus petauri TaxID=1940789 RepID=UPI0021F17E8B
VLATLTGMIHAAPERFTGRVGVIRTTGEAIQWLPKGHGFENYKMVMEDGKLKFKRTRSPDSRLPSNFTYLKDEKKPVTEREQTRIPGSQQV